MPETRTMIEDEVDDARSELERLRREFLTTSSFLIADLTSAARAVEDGRPVNSLGVCQGKAGTIDRLAALLEAATTRLETARRLAKSAQVVA